MGKQSGAELTLSFLLIATLCSEASVIKKSVYFPAASMNWRDARQYCQKNHLDLVTWDKVSFSQLATFLKKINVEQVWIGLLRAPENDSVWKWINLTSGEGISGRDVSKSSMWEDGQQDSHCALMDTDLMWYSETCSHSYDFYCSENNKIQHHRNRSSWYNASKQCQANGIGELAIINHADPEVLQDTGWIGLHRKGGDTWTWTGDQESDYRNWAPTEPLTADCGSFKADSVKWYSNVCSERHRFACSDDSVVLVKENKTWEEALEHCRGLKPPCVKSTKPCVQFDLLSLSHLSEYDYIRDRSYRATTDELWIGLRFLGGEWWGMDGKRPTNWLGKLPDCPSRWTHCGTLSKSQKPQWIIRDCSERRNFLCSRKTILD